MTEYNRVKEEMKKLLLSMDVTVKSTDLIEIAGEVVDEFLEKNPKLYNLENRTLIL